METPSANKFELDWSTFPNNLLFDLREAAKKVNITTLAIVGGVVRDEFLKNSEKSFPKSSKDLDLVVEGSASQLAAALQKQLGPKRFSNIQIHKAYNTVEMKIDGFPVDIATARLEKYELPGQNPKITPCILEQDLQRRDFTINAIAIELSEMRLLDPHGGKTALEKRELEFLHNKSVEDDPTRIIRAARYSARLLFKITPKALEQIHTTLGNWPWVWKQGDPSNLAPPALATRLRIELELLLEQEPWEEALTNLQNWGGLLLLDRGLQSDPNWKRRLRWASKLEVNLLMALVIGAEDPEALAARLQLGQQQQHVISQCLELQKFLYKLITEKICLTWSPSRWCYEIEEAKWHPNAVALSICNGGPLWRTLLRWWNRWRSIKSPISAQELINKGWEPGPSLGKELEKIRAEKLDSFRQ